MAVNLTRQMERINQRVKNYHAMNAQPEFDISSSMNERQRIADNEIRFGNSNSLSGVMLPNPNTDLPMSTTHDMVNSNESCFSMPSLAVLSPTQLQLISRDEKTKPVTIIEEISPTKTVTEHEQTQIGQAPQNAQTCATQRNKDLAERQLNKLRHLSLIKKNQS